MRVSKALGMTSYFLILAGIFLLVIFLGVLATPNAVKVWWGVAAAIVLVTGITFLVVSRRMLPRHPRDPIGDRVETDPLQPDVTHDEAAQYEAHYHGRDIDRDDDAER